MYLVEQEASTFSCAYSNLQADKVKNLFSPPLIASLLGQKLTSICIDLNPVTFLKPRGPTSLVTSPALGFLYSISRFEAFLPLTLIRPFSPILNPESVSAATEPFTFEAMTIWPNINSAEFETVVPRTFIASLSLWSRTDPISVRFTVLPFSAVSSTILKVKATTAHNQPR